MCDGVREGDGVYVGPLIGADVFVGRGVFVPAGFGVFVAKALPLSVNTHPGHPGMTPGTPPPAPVRIAGSAPLYALSPKIYA